MKTLSTLTFALAWVFGFFSLLAFDLFVEAFVFEWLTWNGTNKTTGFLPCGGVQSLCGFCMVQSQSCKNSDA